MNNNETNTSNEVNNSLNTQPESVTPTTPSETPSPEASASPAPSVETPSVSPAPVASEPVTTEPAPAPSVEPVTPSTSEATPNVPEPTPSVTPEAAAPTSNPSEVQPTVAPAPASPATPAATAEPAQAPATPAPTPAPAEPTNNDQTIGTIKKEKKSIVPVILIFVVILGVCVALPYIYGFISPYFEKKQPNPTPSGPVTPTPEEPTEDPDVDTPSDPVAIAPETVINFEDLSFSNLSITELDNTYYINYTISNTGTETYTNDKDLYLEIYNNENTFLGRAIISLENSLMASSKTNLRSEISDSVYSSAAKVNVVSKTELDYPNVTLNETNTIVCRKGIETITYTFVDEKLTTFKDVYEYSIPKTETDTYSTDSLKYRNLLNSYINYGAITSFIENETETDSTFTASVTLTLSDTLDSIQKATLKNMNPSIYDKDTVPKVIKFKQEANAYICE